MQVQRTWTIDVRRVDQFPWDLQLQGRCASSCQIAAPEGPHCILANLVAGSSNALDEYQQLWIDSLYQANVTTDAGHMS